MEHKRLAKDNDAKNVPDGTGKDSPPSTFRRLSSIKFPTRDLLAGLTLSIPSIPDTMASALLAGVNPVYGLYSLMIGTPVAAIFTGSVFMNVVTTGAMSITVGGGLANFQGEDLINALVTVTLIVGFIQVVFGLLRLGFLTRFVSNAVMTGFITGIAILIILSQTGTLTGFESDYANKVLRNYDLITHASQINLPTTLLGVASLLVISLLSRGFLAKYAMLIAVVASIGLVMIFHPSTIQTVAEISNIPSGVPQPYLPVPVWDFGLVASGFAVAIIGLLQGAGISSEYPNPNGKYPNVSRDFFGQGIANLVLGFFRGMPVGGSMSATVMIVSSGARSRWANIFTGVLAFVAVFLLRDFIVQLPMTVLAAILIVAGVQAINFERIRTVWETGLTQKFVMLLTFAAVLALPIAYAVLLGVALHFILFIFHSASGLKLVQLEPMGNGAFKETEVPEKLASNSLTVLLPLGDLFFAGAGYLNTLLPKTGESRNIAVILRLRRQKEVGSTFLKVIYNYMHELSEKDGKLILVGVSKRVYRQLQRTQILETIGEENVYAATDIVTESLNRAISDADNWLGRKTKNLLET